MTCEINRLKRIVEMANKLHPRCSWFPWSRSATQACTLRQSPEWSNLPITVLPPSIFQDHLEDGKMVFDYHMHPGIVTHSNAIELMRSVGLEV
jgi:hypothetical protein